MELIADNSITKTLNKKLAYDEFLKKFNTEAPKTTDDCWTPEAIYNAVLEWVEVEYKLEGVEIVRPFYPGGEYKDLAQYPQNAVVVDNPPFSFIGQILDFYHKNGVKFFLFAPHLTLFNLLNRREYLGAVLVGETLYFSNGAGIPCSFITNLGDDIVRTAPDLLKALKAANKRPAKKALTKYIYPKNLITAATLSGVRGVEVRIKRGEAAFVGATDHLKSINKGLYGGGLLLSDGAAARIEAARIEAARIEAARIEAARIEAARIEAARGGVKIVLSDRERAVVRGLNEGEKGLFDE